MKFLPSTVVDVDVQSNGGMGNLETDDWGCGASPVLESEPSVADINLIVAVQYLRPSLGNLAIKGVPLQCESLRFTLAMR